MITIIGCDAFVYILDQRAADGCEHCNARSTSELSCKGCSSAAHTDDSALLPLRLSSHQSDSFQHTFESILCHVAGLNQGSALNTILAVFFML